MSNGLNVNPQWSVMNKKSDQIRPNSNFILFCSAVHLTAMTSTFYFHILACFLHCVLCIPFTAIVKLQCIFFLTVKKCSWAAVSHPDNPVIVVIHSQSCVSGGVSQLVRNLYANIVRQLRYVKRHHIPISDMKEVWLLCDWEEPQPIRGKERAR